MVTRREVESREPLSPVFGCLFVRVSAPVSRCRCRRCMEYERDNACVTVSREVLPLRCLTCICEGVWFSGVDISCRVQVECSSIERRETSMCTVLRSSVRFQLRCFYHGVGSPRFSRFKFQIQLIPNARLTTHNTFGSEGEASHAILFYSKITSASSSSTSSVSDASPYRYRASFGSERRGLVDFGECLPRPHSPGREACAEPQPSWWRGLGRVISSIAMDLRLLLPVLRALLPSK